MLHVSEMADKFQGPGTLYFLIDDLIVFFVRFLFFYLIFLFSIFEGEGGDNSPSFLFVGLGGGKHPR